MPSGDLISALVDRYASHPRHFEVWSVEVQAYRYQRTHRRAHVPTIPQLCIAMETNPTLVTLCSCDIIYTQRRREFETTRQQVPTPVPTFVCRMKNRTSCREQMEELLWAVEFTNINYTTHSKPFQSSNATDL